MASDATETVQEIITDNEIDSLVSDPDKVVDIIMYAKDKVAGLQILYYMSVPLEQYWVDL